MADPLDEDEITGVIRTARHAHVRYRAGHECGEIFEEGVDFDGFTLTIEVSGAEDALKMIEELRRD